ncbi:hypothetical protein KY285_030435 [Solanum tuberosum]|nr:hypothetical protein KY285_030435 [Solanum tuberosum]
MVVSAPRILQNWWQNFWRIHEAEIQGHLGALLSLLGTQCDQVFVTQLMGFWEPSTVTFKFLDFDITPTLEEFSSLTVLPIRGRLPMFPPSIFTADSYKHLQRSTKIFFGAHDPRQSSSFNDSCIMGYNFFGGCSMLLQIWAREHFYRRDPQMDFYMGARNRIESHENCLQSWVGAPTRREEWRTFLNNLIGDVIQ